MDLYVSGFDIRSQIGPERLYRDLGNVRIFLWVWIIRIAHYYFIAEYFSV